ncbi:MAG: glycosyltransferase family 4 protein [Firmicutes bacterium]|nr:glycosyltransferase family 4 protein [Bacillota bacterium]
MRVLLTSILCHSGLMTHVRDLVRYLEGQGVEVAVAYKKVNFLSEAEEQQLLANLGEHNYCIFETADELAAFIKQNKTQLIHAHSHATFTMVAEVSKRLDVPFIVTLHSIYLWPLFFGRTLQAAKKIIAVGPGQAKSATPYLDKIVIIENGIDTKRFTVKNDWLTENPQVINVLWYGRVDGHLSKGIKILDQIALSLPNNIQIIALGSTDYRIRNMPHIKWTDDPVPYLQNSHITYAHGRSLREAMACGSVGMLIGHGYGGLVTEELLRRQNFAVDAFPNYGLARARSCVVLEDLIQLTSGVDLNLYRKQARRLAEKYFDLDLMGRRILALYQEIIK